jgi:hypothetical protein
MYWVAATEHSEVDGWYTVSPIDLGFASVAATPENIRKSRMR